VIAQDKKVSDFLMILLTWSTDPSTPHMVDDGHNLFSMTSGTSPDVPDITDYYLNYNYIMELFSKMNSKMKYPMTSLIIIETSMNVFTPSIYIYISSSRGNSHNREILQPSCGGLVMAKPAPPHFCIGIERIVGYGMPGTATTS
jgi:hypothetical protein